MLCSGPGPSTNKEKKTIRKRSAGYFITYFIFFTFFFLSTERNGMEWKPWCQVKVYLFVLRLRLYSTLYSTLLDINPNQIQSKFNIRCFLVRHKVFLFLSVSLVSTSPITSLPSTLLQLQFKLQRPLNFTHFLSNENLSKKNDKKMLFSLGYLFRSVSFSVCVCVPVPFSFFL